MGASTAGSWAAVTHLRVERFGTRRTLEADVVRVVLGGAPALDGATDE